MQEGLIIKNVTNTYYIKSNNEIYTSVVRGKLKKNEIIPVVGDRVEFDIIDIGKKEAVIEKILERKNYIRRPKCANISIILLVISSKLPKPDLLMIDKQLAFSEFMNIKPIIIINKIDLDNDTALQIKDEYSKIGYNVILTNALTGEGVMEILQHTNSTVGENIAVLAGNSGVGKSSLINSIFNENVSVAGKISEKNKRGKNTTTITSLYKINKDTYLVDTPGFSTFDIDEISYKDLDKYFIEFKEYINKCEFQGCSHIKEDICGIKYALNNAKISQKRYNSYVKIYENLKYKEEHKKW